MEPSRPGGPVIPVGEDAARNAFHTMNEHLEEALDRARQLEAGGAAEASELQRIRELVRETKALKLDALNGFPRVRTLRFRLLYLQFRRIDRAGALALSAAIDLENHPDSDYVKRLLIRYLEVAKEDKEWIEDRLPQAPEFDIARRALGDLNRLLNELLAGIRDGSLSGEDLRRRLPFVPLWKLIAVGSIREQIYGENVGWWYDMLQALDAILELLEETIGDVGQNDAADVPRELERMRRNLELAKEIKDAMHARLSG